MSNIIFLRVERRSLLWTLAVWGCVGLLVMFLIIFIATFAVVYALVSLVANMISGPDPEPSANFRTRLREALE